jgi:hypothetical protein
VLLTGRQEVAVRADPPPRTTSSTSATPTGARWSGSVARSLDDRAGAFVAVRASPNGAGVAPVSPNLERAWRFRARWVETLVHADECEVDLAGGAVSATEELAAEDEACAHAGSDREKDEVAYPSRDPVPLLAEGGEVDVVLEGDRKIKGTLELVRERASLEPLDVLGESEQSALALDNSGDADDDAVHAVRVEARDRVQRRAEALDRRDCFRDDCYRQLDVLPCPDRAGEVADRAADEACADVEPKDEPHTPLEIDGAAGRRAARLPNRFASSRD